MDAKTFIVLASSVLIGGALVFKKPTNDNPGTYHRREREALSEILEEIGEVYEPTEYPSTRYALHAVETRAESGWDNWVITKMEDGSVHIWTRSSGARKVIEPMDVMENRLEGYKEKLKSEGINPNSATGAILIEEWLDELQPA